MRKFQQRTSTLLIVVGTLCLIIGGIFALSAFMLYEHQRGKYFHAGAWFAGSGLVFLFLRFLFISLPEMLQDKKSGVAARRKELMSTYQRPKPSPGVIPRKNDGSILIIVLVFLGIISAVAMQSIVAARSSHKEAEALMKAGLLNIVVVDTARSAMQLLADDPDLDVDSADESWAEYREFIDPAGFTRMIRIQDLQRSFDLNNLAVTQTGNYLPASEVLSKIMVLCGLFMPSAKTDPLRDWIDENAAGSFENKFYESKTTPYTVANRPLYGWNELFQVEGWSPEMFVRKFNRLRTIQLDADLVDCVTIIPAARERIIPLNINTADATTIQGLLGFGREGVAERILQQRKEAPYRGTEFLAELIGEDEYNLLLPYIAVKSRYFLIQASSYSDGATARMDVLASRADDGSVQVVQAYF